MAPGADIGYSSTMRAEIFPRVTVDPTICFGKPTIRGMRIRVSDVLGMLAGGMDAGQILADYPISGPRTSRRRSPMPPRPLISVSHSRPS